MTARAWMGMALAMLAIGGAVDARAWSGRDPLPPVPCSFFPADNVWNADVSALPVHPRSAEYVASIGAGLGLHPDFGTRKIGIPYAVADAAQVPVRVVFTAYGDESDPGPYPIPRGAPIERGSDHHVLVVQAGTCRLYELFAARRRSGYWAAASGASWDLGSNALRPPTWTSADAAGLPILPGLARYDEVASGAITHALRFTAPRTQSAYLWPARHQASADSDATLPPMGLRVRLKADVDISAFSPTNQVILTALKRYGMLLADNGGAWFVTGAPDPRWNNGDLGNLHGITGSSFEAIDESGLMVDPDSGQVH